VQNPPPPSQQQAEEAQQARHSAEIAIRSLFTSHRGLGGAGQNETSSIDGVKIALILATLSNAITNISFRNPQNSGESLLRGSVPHDDVSKLLLSEAQITFDRLAASDFPNDQAAVLWSTWAYSRTADELARIINGGGVEHEFSESGRVLRKVWISRSDRRVRQLHARLHGKTIPTTEDFWRWPHTNQRLRWPGDVEAPLDATAGCRCVCLLTWADQDGVSNTIRKIVEVTE
jgi:hypothetical protein